MSPKIRKSALKVDLHVHSDFSMDGDMSPKEIIDLAEKLGLDAIAVTDHNTIEGGKEAEKLAKGLVVFVGSEIKTESGEIIGLNLKKDVPADLPPVQTCKLIKEQGGFVLVPHPFDKMRRGVGEEIEKIVRYIDAVEVFNARTLLDRFNKNALKFAEEHKLPKVAGSDAHFGAEIGSAYTLVYSEGRKDKILDAVKEGKTKIFGGKTGLRPHWKTFVTKMGKRF
jgi:predicted metal-dependent phosphoesterase TrpH